MKAILVAALLMSAAGASAADFSPRSWPQETRLAAEQREFQGWAPTERRTVRGRDGIIAATVSPIAVEAGLDMLRKGGTAADAAASVALTQITTQLGSVVSYAGIMTVIYYDAKTGRVSSLDAGYGTWREETDPASIPPSDISALTGGPAPDLGPGLGRQVLVPGFMAGIEALQRRFGRYGLLESLQPAIWYAKHGVTVSPTLATLFQMRRKQFERTRSGRDFLRQSGRDLPLSGDVFKQQQLAETLSSVARDGARAMYSGEWAKQFVLALRRDGGKARFSDLMSYRPAWSEAAASEVFGHTVFTNGGTSYAPYRFLTALNAAEALTLDKYGPYWSDAKTLNALTQLGTVMGGAPALHPAVLGALMAKGVDASREGQLTKAYAKAMAESLPALFASPDPSNHHSNALVVVDKDGNIAVMTHTINAVVWGDTGIVVGGIPVPDSAGFQQARLSQMQPGERLANDIADFLIVDSARRPVLAGGSIGSSLLPEVLRIVVSAIAQRQTLEDIAAAPALLINPDPKSYELPLAQRPVLLPQGGYAADMTARLKAAGVTAVEVPPETATSIRGTVALVGFESDVKSVPEVPGVMVYAGAE